MEEFAVLPPKLEEELKFEALARVAHELANPLAVIVCSSEILLDPSVDPAQVREIGRRILCASRLGLSLAQDLIDHASIKNGRFSVNKQPISLEAVLEETIDAFAPTAKERGISLTLSIEGEPVKIMADSTRMAQVASNLVANALKAVSSGGEIDIRLRFTSEGAVVSVTDDGMGISRQDLKKLFRKFFQLNPTPRSLGLGLHIARTIIDAHGGRINVDSAGLGKGSTFSFTLPKSDIEIQASALPHNSFLVGTAIK